jgi:hypothetical protein
MPADHLAMRADPNTKACGCLAFLCVCHACRSCLGASLCQAIFSHKPPHVLAGTTLNAAWVIVPLILIAECFSWYAVLTTNHLGNAIENSIWAFAFFVVGIGICRLLPEFYGPFRAVLAFAIIGIAGYLAFLMTIDIPMYLRRWRTEVVNGRRLLRAFEGFHDVTTRWVVTHELAEWKDEIAWMSLYFSIAVWASLALCVSARLSTIFRAF